ncbi:MAG: cupin domain-containing protein [Thermodesulfobacteriaceae bacterium]|nr:cupin domain-containing protein [Thermodesulfobacteriaceae bacterium]
MEELKRKVLNLKELINYQKGAIVSRTIINKPTGTVTLFSFDKDQGLSEHTAPFDALILVLEGEVKITLSGEPFKLKTGEMLIMPAHEPHKLKALTEFKMLLVMIKA